MRENGAPVNTSEGKLRSTKIPKHTFPNNFIIECAKAHLLRSRISKLFRWRIPGSAIYGEGEGKGEMREGARENEREMVGGKERKGEGQKREGKVRGKRGKGDWEEN